jgi:hypothetical protein
VYAGKAQWVVCQVWNLRQVEVALKYGIDVGIKDDRVFAIREKCFLFLFIVRKNDRFYASFFPFVI